MYSGDQQCSWHGATIQALILNKTRGTTPSLVKAANSRPTPSLVKAATLSHMGLTPLLVQAATLSHLLSRPTPSLVEAGLARQPLLRKNQERVWSKGLH